MADEPKDSLHSIASQLRGVLKNLFNVRHDQASFEEIDSSIRNMVEIKGTNLWVLMLAIIVASVGLNVNSTAVIIGAMLISPLMGPIMGIGYGVGINDNDLIQRSLKSIGIAALISLLSATLYFLFTPLSEAGSELLARTTPTLWDVLIALFGGFAGILATTRKEKSNVIPGVAIATALMPPLCTAGYGLATGHFSYFFGAFYLFFINMVFIALATILFISYINPPHKRFVDAVQERRVHNYILAVVIVTVLPSIYLAYNMVADVSFNGRAQNFIKNELAFDHTLVTGQKISFDSKTIEVTLVGDEIGSEQIALAEKHLKNYRLDDAKLLIRQSGDRKIDLASLKTGLLSDLYSSGQKRIQELETELAQNKGAQLEGSSIAQELATQYPAITRVALSSTPIWLADGSSGGRTLLAYLTAKDNISSADQRKIVAWLKVRTHASNVQLVVSKQ